MFSAHRIAICITGQLSRLELGSKVQRLVIPNLEAGFDVGLFLRLDVEEEIRLARKYAPYQLSFGFCPYFPNDSTSTYTTNTDPTFYMKSAHLGVFGETNESEVKRLLMLSIDESIGRNNKTSLRNLVIETFIQPPIMKEHAPVQGLPENCTNKVTFQNHMRWRESLRECMLMVEKEEIARRSFYDVIMRLREDSFVLKKFVLHRWVYDNKLTTDKQVPVQFE